MRETLTTSPELFSDISWNLLLLGEETENDDDDSDSGSGGLMQPI